MSQRSGERVPDDFPAVGETPETQADPTVREPRRRWRRSRSAATVLVTLIIVVSALTARLFVWPAQGMPAQVSAIIVLNGPGNRLTMPWTWRGSIGRRSS